MILAAGRGTRLGELTRTLPKPLIEVAGKPVIFHTLERLAALGIREVIVNAHHLAETLIRTVGDGTSWGLTIRFLVEETLLETGGGVCNALPLLGEEPFFAVNGDILWDFDPRPLWRDFDPGALDGRLGLIAARPWQKPDFHLLDTGGLCRIREGEGAHGYTYSGLQVLSPAALRDYVVEPFSLNRFYDRAMASGRLLGVPLHGTWFDVGTPERLEMARETWNSRLPAFATAESCIS
ncbi:MAG: nucleotidyltransferase family protein [Magnetococcales bacterium]|nr:nucleotidyltransferase family protein [Magnetococcales bacterium]